MDVVIARIAERKAELDRMRPLVSGAVAQLRRHDDVELTWSSNAIGGNTLTLRETAEMIEQGITVGGKPLRDYLDAVDHCDAVRWMQEIAPASVPLDEDVVIELHRRIAARSRPEIAGHCRPPSALDPVPCSDLMDIPELMRDFRASLTTKPSEPAAAFNARFSLTTIHSFSDGKGRTARLLMDQILVRGGFPPAAIGPGERLAYLDVLEQGSATGDLAPFQASLHQALTTLRRPPSPYSAKRRWSRTIPMWQALVFGCRRRIAIIVANDSLDATARPFGDSQ